MKKKKLLLHLSDQYDQLHADVELLKETVQKLIDGKSRYIPNAKDFAEQLVAKNQSDRMQEAKEAKDFAEEGHDERKTVKEKERARCLLYKEYGI